MSSVFGEGVLSISTKSLGRGFGFDAFKDSQRLGMVIAKDPMIAVEKLQYWMEENLLSVSSSMLPKFFSNPREIHPS